jgi:superfamily I DNA/RNA helicase
MVSAPPDRNRLVVGFPGSGKTQVLVHRAEHLRRTARFGARPFRIFLFTNVLRDYIRSALDVLDLPPGSVCTFDAWCHDFHAVHCRGRAPGRGRPRRPSFDAVRREVLEFIERQGFPGEPLEFALVDEGQDLPLEAYAILRRIALHVTVFADPHQQVYDDRPSLDAIRAALGIPSGAVEMLGAYRNSPAVAALAARFIEDPAERKRYRAQGCAGQKVRERPLLFLAPSFGAEMDRLAEVVRRRRGLNQRVGILASNGGAVERIAEALEERGVEVEKALPPPPEVRATGATWIRFDSDAPKVVGLHSAKGLTFDCVCLPALTRDALGWLRAPSRRRLLFSAVARATQWVYLSAEEGRALGEVLDLLEGEREGLLSVQRAAAEIPSSPASTDREEISIL